MSGEILFVYESGEDRRTRDHLYRGSAWTAYYVLQLKGRQSKTSILQQRYRHMGKGILHSPKTKLSAV